MILYPFLSCTILQRNALHILMILRTLEFASQSISMISSFPGLPWLQFLISFICKNLWSKTGGRCVNGLSPLNTSEQHYEWTHISFHTVTRPPTHFIAQFFFRVNSHAASHWRGYYVLHDSSPLPLLCAPLGLVSVVIIIISVCVQLVSWSHAWNRVNTV